MTSDIKVQVGQVKAPRRLWNSFSFLTHWQSSCWWHLQRLACQQIKLFFFLKIFHNIQDLSYVAENILPITLSSTMHIRPFGENRGWSFPPSHGDFYYLFVPKNLQYDNLLKPPLPNLDQFVHKFLHRIRGSSLWVFNKNLQKSNLFVGSTSSFTYTGV